MAVAKVLRFSRITTRGRRQSGHDREGFVGRILILENPHEAMKTHCQMCYPYRFGDREDYRSLDQISWRVLSMWLLSFNVEIGQVSRAGI